MPEAELQRTPETFSYAIVRVVPRVERGESFNAGVVLFCRRLDFLGARVGLDERRLAVLAADLSPEVVRRAAGGDRADRRGRSGRRADRRPAAVRALRLARRSREHDHPALAGAHRPVRGPAETLARLFAELVL